MTQKIVELWNLLSFYQEAGVDQPTQENSVDCLALSSKKEKQAKKSVLPSTVVSSYQTHIPDARQADAAREHAAEAKTLEELYQILLHFTGCNLKTTSKNTVFSDGNPESDLMLVGEAPGREEDMTGIPFVGRSGQLLDRILAAIGLERSGTYIANILPWRPPGNRPPTPIESEICRPFIQRQIELAHPRVLVTLGGPATKTLLDIREGILRVRGNWKTHQTPSGLKIPTMPTLHPAYLLRNPAQKKLVWKDFLEIKAFLSRDQKSRTK